MITLRLVWNRVPCGGILSPAQFGPGASSMEHVSRSRLDRWLLRQVHTAIGKPAFGLQLGDAAVESAVNAQAELIVRFRSRLALVRVLLDPETGFGNGYACGDIDVSGDLLEGLDSVYRTMQDGRCGGWLSKPISWAINIAQTNDQMGSKENARRHYDFGESFYRLWLDRQLVYSCAYYPVPDLSLEQAQIAKMDHVCRKLQLARDERVVEAGCGWGAQALFMARHYGVKVTAFNVSHEQVRYARWRAKHEGLDRRVEFIADDYRNIGSGYDAFVSIGMLEHVGREHYSSLGKVIHTAIGSRGRGLLHFIGRSYPHPLSSWIRTRIFPGAYAPTLRECTSILEPERFAVLDVENLRPHYANTLAEWLLRFDSARDEMLDTVDESFLRAWRLYLAGSLVAFRTGTLQLFQVSFAGQDYPRVPWTREHLYAVTSVGEPESDHPEINQPQSRERNRTRWTPAMS